MIKGEAGSRDHTEEHPLRYNGYERALNVETVQWLMWNKHSRVQLSLQETKSLHVRRSLLLCPQRRNKKQPLLRVLITNTPIPVSKCSAAMFNHTELLGSLRKWSMKAQKHGYITWDKRGERESFGGKQKKKLQRENTESNDKEKNTKMGSVSGWFSRWINVDTDIFSKLTAVRGCQTTTVSGCTIIRIQDWRWKCFITTMWLNWSCF